MEGLTPKEIDAIGEIANISMGSAATAIGMMVNRVVNITTPNVSIVKRSETLDDYDNTCIFVQIHYIKGLTGNNVLILKNQDVMCMTDLMMGGSGRDVQGEVGELQLSAISEAMNQMMGTSATSMSTMLDSPVDISTPEVKTIDVESIKFFEKAFDDHSNKFVKVSFKMDIEDLIDSTMVQLYPVDFAKEMCQKFEQSNKK